MRVEEEYNSLGSRVHLSSSVSASLEFFGYVEFNSNSVGLTHRYPCWSGTVIDGNDAEFYVGTKNIHFHVPAGSAIFVPPYVPHHVENLGPEICKDMYFGFEAGFISQYSSINDIEKMQEVNKQLNESPYKAIFFKNVKRLMLAVNINDESSLAQLRPIILAELFKLYNHCFQSNAVNAVIDPDAAYVRSVKNMIMDNLNSNITVETIAKDLYISQRQLGKIFMKVTGMSCKEYINSIKMEQACAMLYSTDSNISQIADSLGYCDIHYFSRKFKEYYGCSPNKLRKRRA